MKRIAVPVIAVALATALAGCGQATKTETASKPVATEHVDVAKQKRHARIVRSALRGAGFGPPVTAVRMDNATDVTIGTIGDPVAVCNQLVNGGYNTDWMTHVYVSSTNKGSASWIPGDAGCS
jgi:hypothetical protein